MTSEYINNFIKSNKENNSNYCSDTHIQNFIDHSSGEEDQITFINYSRNYCVCFVDIVDSTKNTCEITESNKIRQYYSVFLNTMASIIKIHNGKAIKNSGDSLLYYFPKTSDSDNEKAFEDVLNCGLAMINENKKLKEYYCANGLSSISYRISANYGRVELAVSLNSNNADLFGSSVNLCSKINHLACPNQMIIHKDLYEVLERMSLFDQYIFRGLNSDQEEIGKTYPRVYSVDHLDKINISGNIRKSRQQYTDSYTDRHNKEKSSFNILLIDDDEDILFTFKTLIQDKGYKVNTFSNPLEVLSHFTCVDPYFYDLVIMDIRMPGLNGIKLYSKIKLLNPDVRVLFLSALNALDEILSIFPEIKYSEVMRKPIEPAILLSKVDTIVRS